MPKYIEKQIPDQGTEGARVGRFRKWLEESVKLAKAKPGQLVLVNDELVGKAVFSSMDERLSSIGESIRDYEVLWSREKTDKDINEKPDGSKSYRYFGWVQLRAKTKAPARKA